MNFNKESLNDINTILNLERLIYVQNRGKLFSIIHDGDILGF